LISLEEIHRSFPAYLSLERQEGLLQALNSLSPATNLFVEFSPFFLLQGDVWRGLPIFDFDAKRVRNIRGVILSNSCDISPENDRYLPPKVSIAPIIPVSRYRLILEGEGIPHARIENHLTELRKQAITSMMYLPQNAVLGEEHLVMLSDVHSVPLTELDADKGPVRLISMNNAGFYLFLFKLTVHFCRMHEGVDREAQLQ
jgi:hypothetical protein